MKNILKVKKVLLLIALVAIPVVNAQVRMTGTTLSAAATGSAFIDASSNAVNNGTVNMGKGLVFPRVSLTTFTFGSAATGIGSSFPTRYDGMIVYNTDTSGVANVGSTAGTLTAGYWFYENKSTSLTGGTWQPLAAGKSLLSGTSNPTVSTGSNGDFFINTASNTIFGPKAAGAWPSSGTSIIGATGPAGSNATVTSNNGITTTAGNVQLGGTLTQATTLNQNGFTMAFTSGNVGIGTSAPKTKLDISGYITVGSSDGSGDALPVAGMIRFDSVSNKFQGYVNDANSGTAGNQPGWINLN